MHELTDEMTAEVKLTDEALAEVIDLRRMCAVGEARRIRERSGASLAELGKAAGGIPAPTIYRWESGQRRPRATPAALAYRRTLLRLAA